MPRWRTRCSRNAVSRRAHATSTTPTASPKFADLGLVACSTRIRTSRSRPFAEHRTADRRRPARRRERRDRADAGRHARNRLARRRPARRRAVRRRLRRGRRRRLHRRRRRSRSSRAGAVDRPVAEATVGWMIALTHQRRARRTASCATGNGTSAAEYMGRELRDRTLGVDRPRRHRAKADRAARRLGHEPAARVRPVRRPGGGGDSSACGSSTLDELLQTSDFVSIHCPLTEQTRGLIGARELALMKPDAYLHQHRPRRHRRRRRAVRRAQAAAASPARRSTASRRSRSPSRTASASSRTCCSPRTASPGRTSCSATSAGRRARGWSTCR